MNDEHALTFTQKKQICRMATLLAFKDSKVSFWKINEIQKSQ